MPSLASVFLFLAVLGGIGVLLQGVGALVGLGGDHEIGGHVADHDFHLGHGDSSLSVFNFRSLRAITTGVFFAGLGGLLALRQFGGLTATALAVLLGLVLYLFVAFVMRGFSRLDDDHSVHPLSAVGLPATVSLSIPAAGHGPGKVTLVVAGRRVEWPAIQSATAHPESVIASGSAVQVVDAADDTTLTVVPLPDRS